MKKKLDPAKLNGGDCLILKASKQRYYITFIDDKNVYLYASQNSVYFPKNKLSRYFVMRKKAKKVSLDLKSKEKRKG